MSSLTLRLRTPHPTRLNLSGLTPDRLLDLSIERVAQTSFGSQPQTHLVGDYFEVIDGSRERLILQGDLRQCDYIAGQMRAGELQVESQVGDYVAAGMRGGELVVHGATGMYTACDLRGGSVRIRGHVGDYAAAAAPGKSRGMSGGTLVIEGDAGQWLASRMRRGTLIIYGQVDSGCATRMIAGTLVAVGTLTSPFGYGMLRGSLLILNPDAGLMASGIAGFTPAEPCQLAFLPILLREIAQYLPADFADDLRSATWSRSLGDRGEAGQAEVLFRDTATPKHATGIAHA